MNDEERLCVEEDCPLYFYPKREVLEPKIEETGSIQNLPLNANIVSPTGITSAHISNQHLAQVGGAQSQTYINPVTGQVQIGIVPSSGALSGGGNYAIAMPMTGYGAAGGAYTSIYNGAVSSDRSISIDGVVQITADSDAQLQVRFKTLEVMVPFDCFACIHFKKCDMKILTQLKRARDALSR